MLVTYVSTELMLQIHTTELEPMLAPKAIIAIQEFQNRLSVQWESLLSSLEQSKYKNASIAKLVIIVNMELFKLCYVQQVTIARLDHKNQQIVQSHATIQILEVKITQHACHAKEDTIVINKALVISLEVQMEPTIDVQQVRIAHLQLGTHIHAKQEHIRTL